MAPTVGPTVALGVVTSRGVEERSRRHMERVAAVEVAVTVEVLTAAASMAEEDAEVAVRVGVAKEVAA